MMKRLHRHEWALSVLRDLGDFFDSNGMHESAEAVQCAAKVVHRDLCSGPNAKPASLMISNPVQTGNIIRFSVTTTGRSSV